MIINIKTKYPIWKSNDTYVQNIKEYYLSYLFPRFNLETSNLATSNFIKLQKYLNNTLNVRDEDDFKNMIQSYRNLILSNRQYREDLFDMFNLFYHCTSGINSPLEYTLHGLYKNYSCSHLRPVATLLSSNSDCQTFQQKY